MIDLDQLKPQLLECVCGNAARITDNGVFCSGGTYMCEAEAQTAQEWNAKTIEHLRNEAILLRKRAKTDLNNSKRIEERLKRYVS